MFFSSESVQNLPDLVLKDIVPEKLLSGCSSGGSKSETLRKREDFEGKTKIENTPSKNMKNALFGPGIKFQKNYFNFSDVLQEWEISSASCKPF